MMLKLSIAVLLVLSVQGEKAVKKPKVLNKLAADPQEPPLPPLPGTDKPPIDPPITDAPPTKPPAPPTPKPTQPEICADTWTQFRCIYLFKAGWCYKNPGLMKLVCKKTCHACSSSENCNDLNLYCSYWAQRGACRYNPAVMQRICRKSCKLC